MGNPRMITREMKISATPEVWLKLERFFALMHFNGGHTAIFGIAFDGDGADAFKIDPPPREELRKPAQRIGDAGPTLEIANENSYTAKHVKVEGFYVMRDSDVLLKDGGNGHELVVARRYD